MNIKFYIPVFDNDVDAMIPELWAAEGLLQLENNTVAANLVHRDFSADVSNHGDVVNAYRPRDMKGKRKGVNDDIVPSNTIADSIAVPLDQYIYESFIIKETEAAWSFKDLVAVFLTPAMRALSDTVDKVVLGQVYSFLINAVGQLGGLTVGNFKQYLLLLRKNMNDAKVPVAQRNLILSTVSEMLALNLEEFTSAEKVGDKGTSMRDASLGKVFGFDTFMAQNTPTVNEATIDTVSGSINFGAGYAVGATALIVDGFSIAPVVGSYVTFTGSKYPYQIVAATTTLITLNLGLKDAILDNAIVSVVKPLRVNAVTGYPAKYDKYITIDNFSTGKEPQIGQLVSVGTEKYSIIDIDGSTILLNRPLKEAVADNAYLNLGPAGSYSFAFNKNSIAFVNRPLPKVRAKLGAESFVISANGISLRVVMQYDSVKDGTRVTLALLCGVAVLDERLGHILLG